MHVRGTKSVKPDAGADVRGSGDGPPSAARTGGPGSSSEAGRSYATAARARPEDNAVGSNNTVNQQNFQELRAEIQQMKDLFLRVVTDRGGWGSGTPAMNHRGPRDLAY